MKDNTTNQETLVSTEWVEKHRNDKNMVIAEVDVDTAAYDEGHIPGSVGWNWKTQLCDTIRRDILSKPDMEKLLSASGAESSTMLVLYGDNNNWFAAWAYWQLKMFGHKDVRIMDGGRKKWISEGRELTKDVPKKMNTVYKANGFDGSFRAFINDTQSAMEKNDSVLIDVRSPDEFTGKILAPPGLPETCQRGGHIPGAVNIPWATACNEDGTFKSSTELTKLYSEKGVTENKNVITYCRIGERSSHTWFVLKYLLGYPKVRNYDGSWTEWGNMVGVPVEKGE